MNVGGCEWLWMVVGGCGWLWVVVDDCGWLWMVVGGCGWLHNLVQPNYIYFKNNSNLLVINVTQLNFLY